jgi:uncharacterized protein involved in exopolysaccharide biosynthesis
LNLSSGEDRNPDADGSVSEATRRFRFPLPFDPVRLLAGVMTRWPWIAVGMLVFGTLGTIVGIQITSQSFAISASLIKRRVPQTVQASETGQAFRPVDLNDATLLATLLASEPLDLASKRADNGIDSGRARSLTEASQLEGTDIFYITYHSPLSPKDAVTFSGIWAEEINAYTKRLQQTEARDVRAILEKEVAAMEKQIEESNLEILNFSKEKDFLGGDAQVAAVLGKLSQIELELEAARTSAAAKKQQLESLTEQISHQSPIELQIKSANEELANLRSTYTDENPLVQAKLQSMEYLEGQIAKLKEAGKAELEAYTGTPLGNQIYLTIIGLRNELLAAESSITSLEKLRQSTAARLAEFPAIISGYEALQKKRDSYFEALSLMKNRLKEAEIFASGAPGYWQVFQAPDPRSIIPSSLVKKPALLGTAGALGGAGLAVLLTLLLTHRTSRRSILECCAATRAPLICHLPTTLEEDARAAIAHFWITHLAPRLDHGGSILFWTAALDPGDERRLWSMLSAAASKDTGKPMEVIDLTPDTLWADGAPTDSLVWSTPSFVSPGNETRVLLRAALLPQRDARAMLSQVDHWIAVVAGQKQSLQRAVEFRPLADAYLPACGGTIAWTERPQGRIREAADAISCFLAKRFS